MKNKVLQFFKLNGKIYEEFYSVGKQNDYMSKIDSDEGSGVASVNSSVVCKYTQHYCLAVKFAPNFGRSYNLIATCDMGFKIAFWKLDTSKIVVSSNPNAITAALDSLSMQPSGIIDNSKWLRLESTYFLNQQNNIKMENGYKGKA